MSDRYYYVDYITKLVKVVYGPYRFSIVYSGIVELKKDIQHIISNFDRDFSMQEIYEYFFDTSVPEYLESKAGHFGWHKLDKLDFIIEEEIFHPGLFVLRFPPYQWYVDNDYVRHDININRPDTKPCVKTESEINDSKTSNKNYIEKENDNMKYIKTNIIPVVTNVQIFNDRVVKVTFADGSFTKAICAKDDIFNIDTGIMVCLIRRMIAKDADNAGYAFNRLMSDIHHTMEKNEKNARKERERLAKEKAERKAINKNRERKNDQRRCDYMNEMSEIIKVGVLNALLYRDENPNDQLYCDNLNNYADAIKVGVLNALSKVDGIQLNTKDIPQDDDGADE